MLKEKANIYAKEKGYKGANYVGIYKRLYVYDLELNEESEVLVGYPIYLLIDINTERIATPDETLEILGINPKEKTFKESLL